MYTINQLCQFAGYSLAELRVRSRKSEKVYARYAVMEYLRKNNYSLSLCASVFSLDHTTTIHGLKEINNPRNPIAVKAKEMFLANMELNKHNGHIEMPFIYDSLIEEYHG